MEYSCVTDIGLTRDKNQDSYLFASNAYGDVLAIVCDGIGGGKAGEVASSEVVRYFDDKFKLSEKFSDTNQIETYLQENIAVANTNVYELSRDYREYRGMGTTLSGILIAEKYFYTLNCGDSRVYGFMDHNLYHLTRDHSLVNQMLDNKEITPEEAINHPKRHYLVKAIGIFEYVESDIHRVKDMEYFLVCSDGLYGMLTEAEITEIIYDEKLDTQAKVEALKDLSLLKGGYDNVTIILIKR